MSVQVDEEFFATEYKRKCIEKLSNLDHTDPETGRDIRYGDVYAKLTYDIMTRNFPNMTPSNIFHCYHEFFGPNRTVQHYATRLSQIVNRLVELGVEAKNTDMADSRAMHIFHSRGDSGLPEWDTDVEDLVSSYFSSSVTKDIGGSEPEVGSEIPDYENIIIQSEPLEGRYYRTEEDRYYDRVAERIAEETGIDDDVSEFESKPSHQAVCILKAHGKLDPRFDPINEYNLFFADGEKSPSDYYKLLEEVKSLIKEKHSDPSIGIDITSLSTMAVNILIAYDRYKFPWERTANEFVEKYYNDIKLGEDAYTNSAPSDGLTPSERDERTYKKIRDDIDKVLNDCAPYVEVEVFDSIVFRLQTAIMNTLCEFMDKNHNLNDDTTVEKVREAFKRVDQILVSRSTEKTDGGFTWDELMHIP